MLTPMTPPSPYDGDTSPAFAGEEGYLSLLNGTSLSTRTSAGMPSTRSATMLRRISSVPMPSDAAL